jgi:hypothetical protein
MFEWRWLADLLLAGFVNFFRKSIPFWLYLLVQGNLFPLFACIFMLVFLDLLVSSFVSILIYTISYI